ncbi:hypothetical protein IWQ61_008200 [Dispira simplex]|nr:hypothetical protein IWQ61_008200 [Dispira simplex]
MTSLAVMKFRSYLEQSCWVRVTDDRWFEGHLMCTDRDCNIVLARTCEIRGGK